MSIRLVAVDGSQGAPDIGWSPVADSLDCLVGDVMGLYTNGQMFRTDDEGGQVISSGGGVWGVLINNFTSDADGNIINSAAPANVSPTVPAQLALSSYNRRILPNDSISGVVRGMAQFWTPDFRNVFIQRQKQGTRINSSYCGKKCDLVYNDATNEWEVDVSATSVGDIIVSQFQYPLYKDNNSLWDSASFATDDFGAWVAFQFNPAFNAEQNGLRYTP